jgi:hypothetical protein
MTQQINFNKLPKLKYNQQEITNMTYEYFQYLVLSFWNETKQIVSEEEFVAMATAIAMRQAKVNNVEEICINKVRQVIREIINEEKSKSMCEAHRNEYSN